MPRRFDTMAAQWYSTHGPDGTAAAVARIRAEVTRLQAMRLWSDALAMQLALMPGRVATPMLQILADAVEDCIQLPGSRLVISCPPQEGKTSLLRMALLRKLIADPGKRCAYIANGQDLADDTGLAVRRLIEQYGSGGTDPVTGHPTTDRLGIGIARDRGAVSHWQLAGHEGGLLCAGIGGTITGRPIDGLAVIDDPVKNREQAHSEAIRRRNEGWWTSTLETRFSGTSLVLMHTRWAEDDLVGFVLGLPDADAWRVINIPAVSALDPQSGEPVPDALGRAPGVWLTSAREDRQTPQQWELIRLRVGEFDFAALYQGRPAPLEGGAFKLAWFQRDRVDRSQVPPLALTIVVVDQADNPGGGDDAGIVTLGATRDGEVYVLADDSGTFTLPGWYRRAVYARFRHDASLIYVEQLTSGNQRDMRAEWVAMRAQATALVHAGAGRFDPAAAPDSGVLDRAVTALAADRETATGQEQLELRGLLVELWPYALDVLHASSAGPPVRTIVARGKKIDRALDATPPYEQRRVHHAGVFPELEHQASTWQTGQPSPGRLDALAHGIAIVTRGRLARAPRTGIAQVPTHVGLAG